MEGSSKFNLPSVNDFRRGGIFYGIKIGKQKIIPSELMKFIFSDYTEMLFKQKPMPNKKTMNMIREYCISTKKTALKEDNEHKKRLQKEIETKKLEENMREYFDSYYRNLYKNCTCNLKNKI